MRNSAGVPAGAFAGDPTPPGGARVVPKVLSGQAVSGGSGRITPPGQPGRRGR